MEFFQGRTNENSSDTVPELLRIGKGLDWLKLNASPHSPGLVDKSERVWRQVVNPVHWDISAGEIKPTIFDDIKSRGLSLTRANHCEVAAACDSGRGRAPEPRIFLGLLGLDVDEMVQIAAKSGEAELGVFDTALATDKAHADACLIRLPEASGEARRIFRMVRQDLFLHSKDFALLTEN